MLPSKVCDFRISDFCLPELCCIGSECGNPLCTASDTAKPDLQSSCVLSDLKCMLCCMSSSECLHDECNFHESCVVVTLCHAYDLWTGFKTKGFHVALSVIKLCSDTLATALACIQEKHCERVTASTFGARGRIFFSENGIVHTVKLANLHSPMLLWRVMALMSAYQCNVKIM